MTRPISGAWNGDMTLGSKWGEENNVDLTMEELSPEAPWLKTARTICQLSLSTFVRRKRDTSPNSPAGLHVLMRAVCMSANESAAMRSRPSIGVALTTPPFTNANAEG